MRAGLLAVAVVAASWAVASPIFVSSALPLLGPLIALKVLSRVSNGVLNPYGNRGLLGGGTGILGAPGLLGGGTGILGAPGLLGGGGLFGNKFGKRSVRQGDEIDANLLLTTVTQLDPNGCILKLVCSLQTKAEKALSPQETVLAHMFSDAPDSVTSSNAAFVYATGVGRQTRDPASCDKLFSKCLMEVEHLSRVLERAWGCGLNYLD